MPRDRGACPRGSRTCPPGERPSVRPLRGGCGLGLPTWVPQPGSPGHAGPPGSPPRSCRSGLSRGGAPASRRPESVSSRPGRGGGGARLPWQPRPALRGGCEVESAPGGAWGAALWARMRRGEGCEHRDLTWRDGEPQTPGRACCTCHLRAGRGRRPSARLRALRTRPR